MKLYHGTANPDDFQTFSMEGRRKGDGDFHFKKAAFYTTDYEENAIEYACKSECLGATAKVTVIGMFPFPDFVRFRTKVYMCNLEFDWEGSENVHMFSGLKDADWAAYQEWVRNASEDNHTPHEKFDKIHNMDMVAGPMQSEG
ncbi:hypothetical protein H0H93_001634, partial [Arthromyces matolae]